jgi:hypothetical protein
VLISTDQRSGGPVTAPLAFTAADLEAYERGIAREAQLVVAARERGRAAKTPAERAKAAQAEWEDQTAVGGAQARACPWRGTASCAARCTRSSRPSTSRAGSTARRRWTCRPRARR